MALIKSIGCFSGKVIGNIYKNPELIDTILSTEPEMRLHFEIGKTYDNTIEKIKILDEAIELLQKEITNDQKD